MNARTRRNIATGVVGVVLGILAGALLNIATAEAAVPTGSAANQPANWQAHLLNDKGITAQCYKHEANGAGVSVSEHGVSVGNSVKLSTFNPAWYGDYWALLVIKSSTNNQVIYNPAAGVWYQGVAHHAVSHWIVCKGVTPVQTTTTTTTTRPPTTTVTTTRPECGEECKPTTTVPPTTVPPTTAPPTTTPPSTSTSTVVVTSVPTTVPTTVVEVSSAIEERPVVLAYTGSKTKLLVTLGILLTFAGVLLSVIEHDYRKRKAI